MPDLSNYKFATTHEWVKSDGDVAVVGITEHAQAQLGDIIFVELPPVGTELEAGKTFGAIESVKAASDLYSPVSGKVVEINDSLTNAPEQVNNEPYGSGWMLKLSGTTDNDQLVDQATYEKLVG